MKRFCVFACLCLICVVLMADTALAGDVSSTAISLDLAAGSVEIYESDGITYCVQNEVTQATTGGVIVRQTDSGTATANTITVSGGNCKLTISGLNIKSEGYKSAIAIEKGSAMELHLLSSNTVIGADDGAGILAPDGTALTITGSGNIVAIGGWRGAGIGGINVVDGGIITINSGTVVAEGGENAAGIGGGSQGAGGTITINGGTVTATGGDLSAGIGGSWYSDGSTITINGGTVTAVGGRNAYSIGRGDRGYGGVILVSGGTVSAKSIGGGGTVTINGGTVTTEYIGICDTATISKDAIVTNAEGNVPEVEEVIFIDRGPLSSAAHFGKIPILSVIARGHSGLHYQWQISSDNKNWSDVEGETASATASFTMTEDLVGAYLRCKLTNGWGNVAYTDSAQIYVLAFAQQPTSVEANLNDMVAFDALSTCSNVTYRWQRSYDDGASWEDVPGETYSTLIVNATLAESATKYRCVITATNGDQLASDTVSVNLDLGTLVTYTVQDFWQDADGSGYTVKSQQIFEGLSGETVTATGVDYDGFALNREKSTLSGTVAEDSSLVLTRYFDRNTYSIIFDTNGGGSLPALEALYGAPVEAPGEPARYGHIFAGWYADKALTEAFVFDTMPLDGATVYAKWTPVGADRGIEYTVNGLSLRDSTTFELLGEIPEDDFLVEVSVTNLEAIETDTILLVYYTDEGQMLGMNYMFANTPVGYTATFGASVNNNNGNIGIIRAFVLPSLGNPIPLANSAEIK